MDTTQILYLAGAFLLGFIIAWFAGRGGPKRAAEEAAAETDAVRRKLSTTEADLRKTQGQLKENLATLDQLTADKENLVKMLRTSEQGLSDAGAELNRLQATLTEARDAQLLQATELGHARDGLTTARSQIIDLTARLDATAEVAAEASAIAETAVVAEQAASEDNAVRMADLESQLALARATAERLAEKEALVAAELLLRRREYRDIVTGGEDSVVAALAARDQALTSAQTQLDYMRRDLSMLTAAGAQMAVALEQRTREYDTVRDRLVMHETTRALPEVSLAAAPNIAAETSALTPEPAMYAELAVRAAEVDALQQRYDELKAALDQAIAERNELQSQLATQQGSIEALNSKLTEGQQALETLTAEKDGLLQQLSARSAVIGSLLARINDFDAQLRSLIAAPIQAENHSDADAGAPAAATQEEEGETHAS